MQVETLRNPRLDAERPMAVTQKFLVVTSNYPARAAGVGKLMRIDRAREVCPELVLISGEDLTPYREASAQVFSALSSFGNCQKLGLDELFVDVTAAAHELLAAELAWAPTCNVHSAATGTCSAEAQSHTGTDYRPQDLRSTASSGVSMTSARMGDGVPLLRAASHVAMQCKQAVLEQTGLTVSVGVANNKALPTLTLTLTRPQL